MASERRNDIGWKIAMSTVAVIVTLFFNNTYNMSKEAEAEACANTLINAVQKAQIEAVRENISKIDKNIEKILDRIEALK